MKNPLYQFINNPVWVLIIILILDVIGIIVLFV